MSDGNEEVRKVSTFRRKPKRQVLPLPRQSATEGNAGVGVFGTAPTENTGAAGPVEDFDGSIRNELLRLLGQSVAAINTDTDPRTTSGGAMLARLLLQKAIKDGTLNAIIEVLDRIEGKATKAAQNKPTNQHINDQLDVSLETLNDLTTGES